MFQNGGRGYWGVNYTGIQSFKTTYLFFDCSKTLGTFLKLDCQVPYI